MGEDFQAKFAALALAVAASDKGFEATFDHRHDRFNLDAITVGGQIEAGLHQPSVVAAGRFVGRSPMLGRNDRADLAHLASECMVRFRVKAGRS